MRNFWLEPRTLVAYAVSILALAEIVDLTIVAVAIPDIMGSLSANLSEVSLTMTSYIVAAAVCIPLTGLAIRKFGMKKVTLFSAALFALSSVLCGISTSLNEMIFFRLLQGVGGACLPSLAQAYISQNFTQQEQVKVMTVYSLCVVMGPIIGPVFGGVLTESLSWRWCFYVNVPICLVGFIMTWKYMQNKVEAEVRIDYISFAFMAIGIACLEYFIDEGNSNSWLESLEMIIILTSAIILIGFFIWRGMIGNSVVNLSIFRNTNFVLSCLTMFVFVFVISISMTYFPTMLQQSYGFPVDLAGYISAPRGIAAFVVAPLVAKLMTKVDPRRMLVFGMVVFAFSCYLMAGFGPQMSKSLIITTLLIQGAGMMTTFIPLMTVVFTGIPEELHGDVSGMFNFFRNFASSVGTSVAATIVARQMQVTYHDMGAHVSPYARGFQWWSQNLNGVPLQEQVLLAQANVIKQGLLVSYLDSFFICSLLLLVILWLPFILAKPLSVNPHALAD